MQVRPALLTDSPQIAEIYNHYIAISHATFEVEPIGESEMLGRMTKIGTAGYPFLVCEESGDVLGYAYGHQFRPRQAYRHAIEVSVYVKPGHYSKNIGTMLYEQLFSEIKRGDFHAII